MLRCSISSVTRAQQIKSTLGSHLTPARTAVTTSQQQMLARFLGKGALINHLSHFEIIVKEFPQQLQNSAPIDSSHSTSVCIPKRIKVHLEQQYLHIQVYHSTIHNCKITESAEVPSTVKRIKKNGAQSQREGLVGGSTCHQAHRPESSVALELTKCSKGTTLSDLYMLQEAACLFPAVQP